MRTATWLVLVVAIGAIARAEPPTGTVIVSCNVADAWLVVDSVAIADRTPAVLTLPAGTHVIEARKPPLIAQKKVIEIAGQQQIKLRFELMPPAPPTPVEPPATGSNTPIGSGSGAPPASGPRPALGPTPATGPAAPPASGSAAPPGAGSAAPPATGPAAPPASGSAAPPGAGSAESPVPGSPAALAGSGARPASLQASPPAVNASHCTEGGHSVPCAQGPHCTEGGKPVSCIKGGPPPLSPLPPPTAVAVSSGGSGAPAVGSGAGSNASAELHASPGVPTLEIATAVRGAFAYVDGAPARDAPCVLELEPGEHVIAVYAAGMIPAEAIVRVDAAQQQRLELTPTKPRKRIDVPAP